MRNVRLVLALIFAASCGGSGIAGPDNPTDAKIITADITNFWAAYDAGGKNGSAMAFQRDYLDRGSSGLRDFASKRAVTAQSLANMVMAYPAYFTAVRAPMIALVGNNAADSSIRAAFRSLESIYPEAIFPSVTLLVGRFSTAGTTSANGLLIGAEFYADATVPRHELAPFQRTNVHGADSLAFIVAHESIHVQQASAGSLRGAGGTLLEQSFSEGSADFLGELISGGQVNGVVRAWAITREAAVWAEFKSAMNGNDVSRWLYNQGNAPAERPGDLGYFVGYQIAKAYYGKQSDKSTAVRAIIRTRDVKALLVESGYDPQ